MSAELRSAMRRNDFWFSVLAVVLTIGAAVYYIRSHWAPWTLDEILIAVAFGLWSVGAPLWFLLEWHRYKFKNSIFNKEEFDQFKHSQDLARNLWVAVALVLGFLLKH